jgi:hypothetical protein
MGFGVVVVAVRLLITFFEIGVVLVPVAVRLLKTSGEIVFARGARFKATYHHTSKSTATIITVPVNIFFVVIFDV